MTEIRSYIHLERIERINDVAHEILLLNCDNRTKTVIKPFQVLDLERPTKKKATTQLKKWVVALTFDKLTAIRLVLHVAPLLTFFVPTEHRKNYCLVDFYRYQSNRWCVPFCHQLY